MEISSKASFSACDMTVCSVRVRVACGVLTDLQSFNFLLNTAKTRVQLGERVDALLVLYKQSPVISLRVHGVRYR